MARKIDKYLALKEKVDAANSAADQAEGADKEVMKQIKKEFGCASLSLAEVKLRQMRKRGASSDRKRDAAVDEFEANWAAKLAEDEDN